MNPTPPNRVLHCTEPWERRFAIDWNRWRAVVFESDDWGGCETGPNPAAAAEIGRILGRPTPMTALETPADLDALYGVLAGARGADGLPAVFTAFTCTGNPDFAAIAADGFNSWHDIPVDQGVPPLWERGDLPAAWRAGVERGVWAPEFHSHLHHTSPVRLLERLRAEGPVGDRARQLFAVECYYQGEHVPEYDGMDLRAQHAWAARGIETFARTFGYRPAAAVTSDAYPLTEAAWALAGIRIVCLKNSRLNSGEVVVYHTKPWNNQDVYVPIGAFEPLLNVVYLTRNTWFEWTPQSGPDPAAVVKVCETRWRENEPAVMSTHRARYVSMRPGLAAAGRAALGELLAGLAALPRVHFLSTAEVGDLYRQGWSARRTGTGAIIRRWHGEAAPTPLPEGRVTRLPDGATVAATGVLTDTGNFLVQA